VLRFSHGAAGVLKGFFDKVERDQRDGGPLESLRSWASKAHGHVARIAAALHMVLHHDHRRPWEVEILEETARNAVVLGEYFHAHAKAAFALMTEHPDKARALRLLRHFKEKRIRKSTKRELHRALPTVFETADQLDRPLELLEGRGYVRLVEPGREPGRPGRGRSLTVLVNPRWLQGQFRQIRQNAPRGAVDTHSVESVSSVEGDGPEPGATDGYGKVRF
jgi:hypothetical protein